jgi:hypothetical protein
LKRFSVYATFRSAADEASAHSCHICMSLILLGGQMQGGPARKFAPNVPD